MKGDYLVNGYENEKRNGNEQGAFFAEKGKVITESVAEFMLLELYLMSQGFDLELHKFEQGTIGIDFSCLAQVIMHKYTSFIHSVFGNCILYHSTNTHRGSSENTKAVTTEIYGVSRIGFSK